MVKVVALTGTLTDASENGHSAVGFRDVIDEFEDDDGRADASTTKGAGFATLDEGANEIDHFDTGLENFGLGILLQKSRGFAVNGVFFLVRHWTTTVGRLTGHIENAPKHSFTDGD